MKRYRFQVEALIEYEDAIEYYERAQGGLAAPGYWRARLDRLH